jgi:hypothetical protein
MYVSRRLCGLGGKICGIGEIRERRNRCLFRRFRSHGAKIQILWRTCKGWAIKFRLCGLAVYVFSPNSRYLTNFQGVRWILQFEGGEWLANCSYEYAKRQRKWVVLWQNDCFKRMMLATLVQYGMFRHFLTSFLPIFNFNNLFLQSLMNIFAIIIIIAGHFGRKMVKKITLFLI